VNNVALVALFAAACGGSSVPETSTPATPATPTPPPKETAFDVTVTGSGRPVVFVPGLGSPGSVWDGTVAHLAGKYQTHVLTLAGFAGVAPIPPPFLLTVHQQLVDYVKHLDHPIVVGHSLGGAEVLWLAETNSADHRGDGSSCAAATARGRMAYADRCDQGRELSHGRQREALRDARSARRVLRVDRSGT
jgi:pimeloyl-ACP methyl ester carboxylesterase